MRFPLPEEMRCALTALEPILPEAVVIGGWAHRLHAEHPFAEPSFEPLTTTDCDVALPLKLSVPRGVSIEDRLKEAGFECLVSGTELGQHRRYVLRSNQEFYVQFVTSRQGDPRRQEAAEELGGVLAEPLRDINLALREPWTTDLLLNEQKKMAVRVIQPVAFLLGKLLVSNQPIRGNSRAKDLVYVADTLRLFERCLEDLQEMAPAILNGLSNNQARRLRTSLRDHFEGGGSDALHAAAVICASTGGGRLQDVVSLRRLLRYGILVLFGEVWIPLQGH